MRQPAVRQSEESRRRISHRIARIEGQIRGVRRMVESQEGCFEILTQVMAAKSALSVLGAEILKEDLLCRKGGKRELNDDYIKKIFTL